MQASRLWSRFKFVHVPHAARHRDWRDAGPAGYISNFSLTGKVLTWSDMLSTMSFDSEERHKTLLSLVFWGSCLSSSHGVQ